MAHGAFGAMGGLQTSATDYAKWVAFLLVRLAGARRRGRRAGAAIQRPRAGAGRQLPGAARARRRDRRRRPAALASTYAMGFIAAADCDLGLTLSHGGGYPGYGSHVLLLPDYGVGIFAFANRTYAGPRPPVWDAAMALHARRPADAAPGAGRRRR